MSGSAEDVPASPASIAPERNIASRKRRRYLILALILLVIAAGLLLPLINIGRYHRTIADSLTRSLGHTVHLGSVNLKIFPLPGLSIQDLIVEEDPSFGAEPLLRAPSVTVYLRLSSLWRQRLEISRIDLDNASVNLARNNSGRWNFASLLLQASRTASAPTAQRRPGPAPRFPYIEFSAARINFKEGSEKKAFSFLNADVSVWLADPNHWRIRFEAQPARTDLDLDLEDTGTMRLDGSLTRAAALDQLPLKLHAEWTGAQLGQVSRLMLGNDSGWRGDLRAEADITGDMRNLQMQSRLRVSDAHRLEFTPLTELDVDARCQAAYHHSQQSLDNLICLWPTGDGHLLLTGSVPNLAHPQPSLNLEINHTPVAFVVSILDLLRRNLPVSSDAAGTINGQFAWAPQDASGKNILTGHAVADSVVLHLANVDQPFTFANLSFAMPSEQLTPSQSRKKMPRISLLKRANAESQSSLREAPVPGQPVLLLEPASFAAGAPTPMQVSGQFTRSGFSLHLTGESSVARLQPVAPDLGQLSALENLTSRGTAQTDLTISGPWIPPVNTEANNPEAETAIQGSIRLQHAQLKVAWLPEPIEVATATAQFGNQIGSQSTSQPVGNNITWANATVSVNGIAIKGSASYPEVCTDPSGCPAQVNLDFPTLDAVTLQSALLGAGRHGELLQAILSQVESPAPPWPPLNATIHAGTLSINSLKLNNARAAIKVRNHHLNILSLDANALGGSAHTTGSVEFASDGPKYALNLTWTNIKLAELAALFPEKGESGKWGTGSIDGQATLSLHGYSNLAASATGDFHWILNGTWSGSPLLNAKEKKSAWTSAGTIANQTLTLEKGPARGTISFDRKLDLTWTGTSTTARPKSIQPPLHITGTLAHPTIAAPPQPPAAKSPRNPRGN